MVNAEGLLDDFFAEAHDSITAWATASIVCSVLLLLLYSWFPDLRRTPSWQFLHSSLCEIIVSIGFVVLSVAGSRQLESSASDGTAPDLGHLLCAEYRPVLLALLAFDVAANCWRLLMYLDLIVVYHNPFRPNTARPLYHILTAVVAAAWVLLLSESNLLCGANSSGQLNVLTLTWGLIYAPFLLFVLVGGSLYLAVKALLSRDKSNNPISRLTRQRVRASPVGARRCARLSCASPVPLLCLSCASPVRVRRCGCSSLRVFVAVRARRCAYSMVCAVVRARRHRTRGTARWVKVSPW